MASIKQIIVFVFSLLVIICPGHQALSLEHMQFDRVINTGSMLVPGPVIQDRDGFIWLGTQGSGLIKFNGYDMKRYPAGPKTFLDGNITALYEDRDGIIWIATLGGLNYYDKHTDSFGSYVHDPDNNKSICHDAFNPSLQTLLEDSRGKLWVGTQNGLNYYDKELKTFVHYRYSQDNPDTLNSSNIFCVYEDAQDFIWVGTDAGLNKYDKDKKIFTRYANIPDNPDSLSKGVVFAIHEDKDGILWVGTSSGLNRFDRHTESVQRFVNDPLNSKSLPNNSIHSIYEDRNGFLWIGHSFQGSGLTLFDKKNNIFTSYRHNSKDTTTLSGDSVMGIYEDSSGIIWLSNLNGTLDKLDKESYKFDKYVNSPDNPHSISDNLVNISCEDSEGTIWFSTNNGLNRYNRETKQFIRYLSNPKDSRSIPGKFVCGPYEDSEKNLWVVSSDNYLSLFDKKKGIVTQTYNIVKFPLVVIEDSTNQKILWITSWGNGLARFNKETHETRVYLHDPKNSESISSNNLVDIYQDDQGIIWLPTMGGGLDLFDPGTGKKIKSYRHDPNDPKSIGSDTVSHIFEDSKGIFWASTYGGGLNRFDKDKETFERFTLENGFPTNSVTNILEDDDQNLWIGSKIGYIRFNTVTEKTKVYTTDDGLAGNEFQEAGIGKSKDGTFWLATITGANSFHPKHLRDNPFVPPVYLTSFKRGGVDIDFKMAPEKVREVRCGWQNNFFEFEFVALNYTSAKHNRYAYRLEGFEDDWNYIGTMRYGRYTNIPGGTFTLHMKGSNNDGIWNEKGTLIKVIVESPPWQRWWAYCIYLGSMVLIVFIIFVYIKKLQIEVADRKQAQQALQESEEKYRDLIENSPDLRFRTDVEGKIVFISQSVHKLSGYSVEEAIGMNMTQEIFENPKERKRFLSLLQKDGLVDNFETQLKRKNGSTWWASTNAHYFKDRESNILGMEGVTRDVSELKQARQKKEKLEARLKQAQKMEAIGTLAGGIAHDFNNILSGIFGYSELAARHIDNPEKTKNYLENIVKGARKAADLVQQILTFSRKSKQDKFPLNIALVVKEALKLLRSSIPATIKIKENIVSNATVIADPTKIHQVVMNLCTNAYHAMQENGGILTLSLDETEDLTASGINGAKKTKTRYLRLTIKDTGHGMDTKILNKIFEPYFTTKEQDKGTGLGLAVVLGIVEEHNGYIKVESKVDMGTQFQVYLPITVRKADFIVHEKDEKIDIKGTETILMIDDEKDILSVTKVFFEQYGYHIITFTDGIQAFEAFNKKPDLFDLIITDMTMPKITGDKLATKILNIRPDIPVILCTGYSHKISKEDAKNLGIRQYIEKPIVLKDLIVSVRKTLDGK